MWALSLGNRVVHMIFLPVDYHDAKLGAQQWGVGWETISEGLEDKLRSQAASLDHL